MTECPKGEHDFPVEDDKGAYCDEHGVTLLWHGPPITPQDLVTDPYLRAVERNPARGLTPEPPAIEQRPRS